MVRQWQTLFYDHRYSHTVLDDAVDFVKIAEGMGAKAIRVTKMEEVEPAMPRGAGYGQDLWYWTAGSIRISAYSPDGAQGRGCKSVNEVI